MAGIGGAAGGAIPPGFVQPNALPIGVPYIGATQPAYIYFGQANGGAEIDINIPNVLSFDITPSPGAFVKMRMNGGFIYPQRDFPPPVVPAGAPLPLQGSMIYRSRDWFRLVRICNEYRFDHSDGRTDYMVLDNGLANGALAIAIGIKENHALGRDFINFGRDLDYTAFDYDLADFFLNLWKIELETRLDGADLWQDYHRAETLPNNWGRMIRDACEAVITVININVTDLYQDPISTMNIVPGEYFITNYAPPPANLGTNSILSRRSLLGLLLNPPVGGVPLDPRKMVPIVTITKVLIQYNAAVINPLPPVGQSGLKRPRDDGGGGGSAGGGPPAPAPSSRRARAFSLSGGKKRSKKRVRKY
jgi:hypothetical protein